MRRSSSSGRRPRTATRVSSYEGTRRGFVAAASGEAGGAGSRAGRALAGRGLAVSRWYCSRLFPGCRRTRVVGGGPGRSACASATFRSSDRGSKKLLFVVFGLFALLAVNSAYLVAVTALEARHRPHLPELVLPVHVPAPPGAGAADRRAGRRLRRRPHPQRAQPAEPAGGAGRLRPVRHRAGPARRPASCSRASRA